MTYVCPVLSVSPAKEDHKALRQLLADAPWLIRESHSIRSAVMVLEECRIPVLVCDRDLPPGTWKDLLEQLAVLSSPPCVIVSCRQADDALWTEALTAGAYDVLAKPFDASELRRTLFEAAQHWHEQYESAPRTMAAAV